MIRFFRWTDRDYEIVLEGSSYYFAGKMCVAFREKGCCSLTVRGLNTLKYSVETQDVFKALSHSVELKMLEEKEFDVALASTYSRSLLRGARRVGLDLMFIKKETNFSCKKKEKKRCL